MKRPSVIVLGVVLILISVTPIFAGCIEKTPATHQPGIQASYQDTELFSLGAESGKVIGPLISKISDDASMKDVASLGTDSARLSSLAGDYYFQMKDLNVSPKYQAWKTNYLLGLLDVQTAGDYFSKSAIAARSDDYTTALTYLQQGNTLFERSSNYIRRANESVSA
jgi:hypothetical protein